MTELFKRLLVILFATWLILFLGCNTYDMLFGFDYTNKALFFSSIIGALEYEMIILFTKPKPKEE